MNTIAPSMKQKIVQRLLEIEKDHGIKILYACESGSRAWGFASKDSDYDVRFLYVHPLKWYLSLRKKRDVIEYPVSNRLDINGWDLPKALLLLHKSNPPLLEWLGSPIIYLERYSIAQQMRTFAQRHYSARALSYHYFHMAHKVYGDYLNKPTILLKKYFYALRPLLAIQWLEKQYGIVPTEFEVLVQRLVTDQKLKAAIDHLLRIKRAGEELGYGPRIPILDAFINRELTRLQHIEFPGPNHKAPIDTLDSMFMKALREVWGEMEY